MATTNPFDLLGEDDNDDPSQLIAAQLALPPKKAAPLAQSAAAGLPTAKPAKLPFKPLPPAQAVREANIEASRGAGYGGGGGGGFGRGRGGGGFKRDSTNNNNTFSTDSGFSGGYSLSDDGDGRKPSERHYGFSGGYRPSEEGDGGNSSERRGYGGPRGGSRGGRRGAFNNGQVGEGEQNWRTYERRSGTGRGTEYKRDGAGQGNWGTPTDEIAPETEEPVKENEKNLDSEKQSGQEDALNAVKENPVDEPEEKEPENKEMTLEEYEKILEEKRKALVALKNEERKVVLDKELESMQQLSSKKRDDEIFMKLGSDKDKRKDAAEKEERAKKSVTINEFLKPQGEIYNSPGGRGHGRGGRVLRGGFRGINTPSRMAAPPIDDAGQFPSLAAK